MAATVRSRLGFQSARCLAFCRLRSGASCRSPTYADEDSPRKRDRQTHPLSTSPTSYLRFLPISRVAIAALSQRFALAEKRKRAESRRRLTRFGQRADHPGGQRIRAVVAHIWLSCRSPHQDDLAKRPVFDQMAQGFACFGEGEDPLDDRLDGSAHDQRDDVLPRRGDRGW
ncbi:hypothetical protein SAMN05414139_10084 [Burkholderia sp. D7]|nr:hypothetical protein SAMN05414139_10084 [Burkholderia sp. D7]